jgi:peptidyl-prolyl cis-trans isomerase C
MQTRKLLVLACLAAFTQTGMAANTPVNNPTVLVVNGTAIDAIQADIVRMDLQQRKRPASDENVRNFLIDNELMAQEAIQRGLDKSPEVKALLDLQRKDILGKALVDDVIKRAPISEERIKAEYEQIKARTGTLEYHPRHILVQDEKLAKDLLAKLRAKKPAKFEDLAKQHSKDSSAQSGGALGWLSANNLVPEFASAMTTLKKGELSKTPVKTQFGWHIIKLDDMRKIDFPDLDKVRNRIGGQLAQQDLRKYLTELRATAKIDVPAK